jgi:hypothetical protein
MGFGARGIAMGNAMASVLSGEITGYYNPAVLPFSKRNKISLTVGILPLDRKLNFLHYSRSLKPNAGFSIFLIHSGVDRIDLRDSDGRHIGFESTSEIQAGISFATQMFFRNFSIGISMKIYYNRLYREISTTTLGLDVGMVYKISDDLSVGLTLHDFNSEYKWDTSELYGPEKGGVTIDKIPQVRRIGISYSRNFFTIAVDYEDIRNSTRKFLIGMEFIPLSLFIEDEELATSFILRTGVENIKHTEGMLPSISFGIEFQREISGFLLSAGYAYKTEEFSPGGMQFIQLGVEIKR